MSTNEDYIEIPLRNKACNIIAYALIDKKNEEKVNLYTWHDNGYGYAKHGMIMVTGMQNIN